MITDLSIEDGVAEVISQRQREVLSALVVCPSAVKFNVLGFLKFGFDLMLTYPQLVILAIIVPVFAAGCSKPMGQVPVQYGIVETEEAVAEIEIGKTTLDEVNALIGPYVESRGLFRLKETGGDRNYFFVVGDRQIWIEFSTGPEGVVTVSKLGELEPKANYIQRWEGGYLTFSPDENPWE